MSPPAPFPMAAKITMSGLACHPAAHLFSALSLNGVRLSISSWQSQRIGYRVTSCFRPPRRGETIAGLRRQGDQCKTSPKTGRGSEPAVRWIPGLPK